MASLSSDAVERARLIRARSRRLRVEAAITRNAARKLRCTHEAAARRLSAELERRERAAVALGRWPYWAPATPDLLRVLVVPPTLDR